MGGTNSAILRYAGASNSDPTTELGPRNNRLVENNLHALGSPGVPGTHTIGEADVNINLEILFTPPNVLTVNGAQFIPPTAPVLLQILSGTKQATDLLPPGSVYVLPRNAVVELTIPGGSGGSPVSIFMKYQVTLTDVLSLVIASYAFAWRTWFFTCIMLYLTSI